MRRREAPCPELGYGLVTRIGALASPTAQLSVRWFWLTDWLARHLGRKRRRGTRVS